MKHVNTWMIPILFIVVFAVVLQIKLPFASDVAYLLYATNQLLEGGKYVSDIFETNPPMILYWYMPVCLIAKWTTIHIFIIMKLYVFLLAAISLTVCFVLLKKLIGTENPIYLKGLFYTLLIVILILPITMFGQREHLLMLVMFPYLLSAALFLENKALSLWQAFFIGLFASLGFALKPFFFVTLCMIELYVLIKKRSIWSGLRMEPIVIFCVFIIYLVSMFLLQPNYIKIILPLVSQYYFTGIRLTWDVTFSTPTVLFCLGIMFSYLFVYKYDRYRTFGTILWLALIGMVAAFLIARTPWYYHVLPALGLAFLLTIHFFTQGLRHCLLTCSAQQKMTHVLGLWAALFVTVFSPIFACSKLLFLMLKMPPNPLITYFNGYAGEHSLFCLSSSGIHHCFPLVYFTHSRYGERFPFFWWYSGLRLAEKNALQTGSVQSVVKAKNFFLNNVAYDLNHYQARWVVMDNDNKYADYIHYFSWSEQFRKAWQHYHYIATVGGYTIYERDSFRKS